MGERVIVNDRHASDTAESSESPPLVSWWWRGLYLIAGFFFVGLGLVGAYLPLLPTTPFLLLASYFLMRSWPAMNARVQRIPIFGRYLRDWQEEQGVRIEVKLTATGVCLVTVSLGLWLTQSSLPVQLAMVVLVAIGLVVVWSLPTIR